MSRIEADTPAANEFLGVDTFGSSAFFILTEISHIK